MKYLIFVAKYFKYKIPIWTSPRRRKILKSWEKFSEQRPLRLGLETISACNSRCVFCAYKKSTPDGKVLSIPLFNKICAEFSALGGGRIGFDPLMADPLLDPHLLERLELIKKDYPNISTHMFTNAIHFKNFSDDELESIINGVEILDISIGGLEREDYKIMFGVDQFDSVWKSLQRISAINNRLGKKNNLFIHIRTNKMEKILASPLLKELKKMGYESDDIIDSFQTWGDIITAKDLPEGTRILRPNNTYFKTPCLLTMIHPKILPNGDVVACGCRDAEKKTVIGNIEKNTLQEIWQGKKMAEFRSTFTMGNLLPLCQSCAMYAPYDKFLSNPGLENFDLKKEFWQALK